MKKLTLAMMLLALGSPAFAAEIKVHCVSNLSLNRTLDDINELITIQKAAAGKLSVSAPAVVKQSDNHFTICVTITK